MNKTEKFIIKANDQHNYIYDYSLTEYVDSHTKIKIICLIHGIFEQIPTNHLSDYGCYQCGLVIASNKKIKKSSDNFIQKANNIHNNKYDYSIAEYKNAKNKIKIICTKHGVFEQTPNNHLSGKGCAKCAFENLDILQKLDQVSLIERFNQIHQNKYNYSLTKYNGMDKKIIIICPKHNIFEQLPSNHIQGKGCYKCSNNSSKLEKQYLDFIGIEPKYRNYSIKINDKIFILDEFDP